MAWIRNAKTQDIPRIAEILVFGKRVAYRQIFKNDIVSFNEIQVLKIAEEYKNNPSLLKDMIVFDDGILKAIINLRYEIHSAEISDFYVEPFFKGQGIGRQMIEYVVSEAKKKGINKIIFVGSRRKFVC